MQKKRKTKMKYSKIRYGIMYILCTKIGWSDMISALKRKGTKYILKRFKLGNMCSLPM